VKAALVRNQLRCHHMMNCDDVVRGIRDHGVAVRIGMHRRRENVCACKGGMANLDCIDWGVKWARVIWPKFGESTKVLLAVATVAAAGLDPGES
jgi:hypothetical protein